MMSKSTVNKSSSLVRIVQERELLKREIEEEERKNQSVPNLPKDCVTCILLQLPIDALQRSSCVCKLWHKMINCSIFIKSHLHRSESVVIFQTSAKDEEQHYFSLSSVPKENPGTFSIEKDLLKCVNVFRRPFLDKWSKSYIRYIEIIDGEHYTRDYNISCLGRILACCNGLILLENKLNKGGLVVLNPVTRKLLAVSAGTICPPHQESYGFVLDPSLNVYKIVHLFRDESGYVSCEIKVVGERRWGVVNGPSLGLFAWFGHKPVSALGALHWLPSIDHNDYIVSMEVENADFVTIPLPKSGRTHDGIIAMGDSLCFVTHEGLNQIDIWVLKSKAGNWMQQQSIMVGCIMDMVPLSGSRFGKHVIFRRDEDGSLYVYDFKLEAMSFIEIEKDIVPASGSLIPHVNSLVSWSMGELISACD
ncbi:hypothetical protein Ancab_038137 [Ancistrocladus abbreviatus]